MMISYVIMTVMLVLVLELLISTLIYFGATRSPLLDNVIAYVTQKTAQIYALQAAVQAGDAGLDPHSTPDRNKNQGQSLHPTKRHTLVVQGRPTSRVAPTFER